MLVRKLKCPSCSAVKVNEIITGYIYCDYCGAYMGVDMGNMQKEAMEVFLNNNSNIELKSDYNKILAIIAESMKTRDIEKYKEAVVRMHEIEFDLFPNRYGPKGKQPAYRQKYLTYYKHMYEETVNEEFFNNIDDFSQKITELSKRLNTTIIENQNHYEFDDNFIAYLEANAEYFKSYSDYEKLNNTSYMQYYPEFFSPASADLMFRNSMNGFFSILDNETVKKCLVHLGLEDEYMDVVSVTLLETNCVLCSASIKVPEGASSVVCEQCGTKNLLNTRELECLNCGASYKPEGDVVKCPFCGARTQTSERPKMEEYIKNINQQYKKPLWKRIFGI